MFKLNTRQRVIISVTILTLVFLALLRTNILQVLRIEDFSLDLFKPLILFLLTYIFMFWISEFKIKGERFITVLGFPSLGVFVVTLFVELLSSSLFGQLGFITFTVLTCAAFSVFTYVLLLTANILNVAYLEEIPLGQAGRAAYYVLSLVISYLMFLMISSNKVTFIIQIVLIFLVPFFLVTSSLWTIRMKASRRVMIAFAISVLISFFYFALSFWPISEVLISFILSIILYITLGVALEVRDNVSRMIWIEYGVLFIIIFLLLIIISDWGINGTLI